MSMIETMSRPERCLACGSPRVAYLLYGLPSNMVDLAPMLSTEEIRMADRTISQNSPQWHCCACHHEWGIADLASFLERLRRSREAANSDKDQLPNECA